MELPMPEPDQGPAARRWSRHKIDVRLKVSFPNEGKNDFAFGRANSLSRGGIGAYIPCSIPVGTAVRLELTFPYSSTEARLDAVATATLRGLVIALAFFGVRAGYARLRSRQGLGMGDVKLAFVAGAWLDWIMIPLAIQLAAFAALSVYVLRQLILRDAISATSRVPFGLFFAPAIWLCFVLEMRWLALL